jgi:hypothetical protein
MPDRIGRNLLVNDALCEAIRYRVTNYPRAHELASDSMIGGSECARDASRKLGCDAIGLAKLAGSNPVTPSTTRAHEVQPQDAREVRCFWCSHWKALGAVCCDPTRSAL